MQVKIKHIGVLSAFKFGCLMGVLPTIVALSILVGLLISRNSVVNTVPLLLSLPSVVIYTLLADLGFGVLFALQAIIYNVVAAAFGGLIIQFDRTAWAKVQLGTPQRPAPYTPQPIQTIPGPIPTTPHPAGTASATKPIVPPTYISIHQPDSGMPPSSDDKDKAAAHDEVAILKRQIDARMKRIEEVNRDISKRK